MPTTNPVPSQDPSDLLFNAGKLDEVLNGTGTSFTDRLGTARRTVAGMNADFDAQLDDAESDLNVYRADAAASAAQALGYMNTIRTTSYGAYASDPATDPLGNPPNVGDEYFNTASNLLKRFNGTTWQASDINTANLASPGGSSLVGYDGQTVQDVLDGAKSLQDYAALRAYTGRAKRIYITGLLGTTKPAGIAGIFQYDPTDTTSADNGGTIIVLADGRRFKRDFDGDVYVKWFEPYCDGVSEDTQKIQKAIDSLPISAELDGDGKEYVVTSTYIKSFMKMKNFRLKTKPGNTDFVSPITIDGLTHPKEHIYFDNVFINGNRQNQTDIVSPVEDGGRHGFRILGVAKHIYIENSEASNCAGDGIKLLPGSAKPASNNPDLMCFQHVVLRNVITNNNRRHGISGESLNAVDFINVTSLYNGLDLNTTDPLTSGTRGARYLGNLYGGPVDIEGSQVGSGIYNFKVIGGNYDGSPSGFTIQDFTDPADVGFSRSDNIFISDAKFGYKELSPFNGCLQILGHNATESDHVYGNVTINNCQISHWVKFRGVENVVTNGGSIVADFYAGIVNNYALIERCKNWKFSNSSNTPFVYYYNLPFTVTRNMVAGAITVLSESTSIIGYTSNGYLVRHRITFTGSSVSPNYFMQYGVNTGYLIRTVSYSFINPSAPSVEVCSVGNTSSESRTMTSISVVFNVTSTTNRQLEIIYEIVNNS